MRELLDVCIETSVWGRPSWIHKKKGVGFFNYFNREIEIDLGNFRGGEFYTKTLTSSGFLQMLYTKIIAMCGYLTANLIYHTTGPKNSPLPDIKILSVTII